MRRLVWPVSKLALRNSAVWRPHGSLATKQAHHFGHFSASFPIHMIVKYVFYHDRIVFLCMLRANYSFNNFLFLLQRRYPVDCTGFHEGEAKVSTEYIHNEL